MAQLSTGPPRFSCPARKPAFYPPAFPAKHFLEYYTQHLNSIEINYTFRRVPSVKTIEYCQVGFITHSFRQRTGICCPGLTVNFFASLLKSISSFCRREI